MNRKYPADFPIAVHPGAILQEMLDERGITPSQLARHLRTDVSRVSEICRRRRGISAEMAVLLAKAFGTSAGLWMNLRKNWELSQVDPATSRSVRPLRASAQHSGPAPPARADHLSRLWNEWTLEPIAAAPAANKGTWNL